jgi:hypothetical protein
MLEPVLQHGRLADPPDPVDPIGRMGAAPAEQVPGRALQHQAQRPHDLRPVPVRDAQLPRPPHAAGDVEQAWDRLPGPEPVVGFDQQPVAQRTGGRLGPRVEGGEQRALADVGVDPEVAGDRRDRRQQRAPGVGFRQRGHPADAVAGREPHAAVPAGLRVQRHPGGREGVDVAVHGPHRHLERLRQLRRGRPAPHLEEEQQLDEPSGAHAASLGANHDSRCQGLVATLHA